MLKVRAAALTFKAKAAPCPACKVDGCHQLYLHCAGIPVASERKDLRDMETAVGYSPVFEGPFSEGSADCSMGVGRFKFMVHVLFSILPIALLIFLMTKKNSLPSKLALPAIALLMIGISHIIFKQNSLLIYATVIEGILTALTPILIIWGAIFLFKTMEMSGDMAVIRSWLNDVSTNKVAQLMIVGWAFPFLIEGASGFGTPAALAAPILVGLGFAPLKVAALTLVMNSIPVSFGAVGTPTWFGFSELTTVSSEEIMMIGIKSALLHGLASLIIPIIALLFIMDGKSIRQNLVFIYISITACVLPFLVVAQFNYEFPSLIGGFIGLLSTVVAAKNGWGLKPDGEKKALHRPESQRISANLLIKALFPIWGTVVLLVITRIPQLGIKTLLNQSEPYYEMILGTLGKLRISSSFSVSLLEIAETGVNWTIKILYIPALIPFILISILVMILHRMAWNKCGMLIRQSARQMISPIMALFGALVFVKLMMLGGDQAPTQLIGHTLANGLGEHWRFAAVYLGALGSFFSGSNTISNLMFGPIQESIALQLGLDKTTILAMQSVGGAMGNMICINNIVAVCSILGIHSDEGTILKMTVVPMIIYGVLVGIGSVFMS